MIQYIYFVKCPDCEDEPFDFFNDAKDYALGRLSQKPVITQVEVNRNDFGECEDSSDLGTIWSWEDMMGETDDEPAISVFTKDDLVGDYDADNDPEFAALDNSLDDVPDNFRKPIPDGMTIEELVEEMEENEDTVECSWCEELFDKSECRREVDLGWLCSRCEAAIKSRGEPLTFRENSYWDFLDEDVDTSEKHWFDNDVILVYEDLTVDAGDSTYTYDEYEYEVDPVDVFETLIWKDYLTAEDLKDFPGGIENFKKLVGNDDALIDTYLNSHFEDFVYKYEDKLKAYYETKAVSYAEDHFFDNPPADFEWPDTGYGNGAFASEADFWSYKEG
jgi:hypothetical protein